jgi:hypothetical protein
MAKLTSILTFNGSLEGLSAYQMKGVKGTIVRVPHGPARDDIHTKPQYDRLRRNLSENGGRNKAVSGLMKAFQPLKPLADFDTAGGLNRLLRVVQKGDEAGAYGKRAVRLSRFPQLAEGFHLTKALPFNSVVRGDAYTKMDRATGLASVELPCLLPGLTFFPPAGYPYCRLVATLGVAPDVVYGPLGWGTEGDYGNAYTLEAQTEWFAAAKGYGPTTLPLQLPYTPPTDSFALVLSVGVQLGEPGPAGGVEPVRKRVGSAKILAVV